VVGGLGIYACTCGDRWQAGGRAAQLLAEGGQPLPKTRTEEAVVTHFDEALGQDLLQKAADELLGGQGAGPEFAGVGSAVTERHLPAGQLSDAVVADGHPKDVRRQILQSTDAVAYRLAMNYPATACPRPCVVLKGP